MANSASDVLKMVKEQEIEWIDLRFTRSQGQVAASDDGRVADGR